MENQLIKDRFESLDPVYAEFVKSDFARDAARSLGEATSFSEEQIIILSNGIMLFLLLFLSFEELVSFIEKECVIRLDSAEKIAGAVLASLPDRFTTVHEEITTLLATTPEKTTPAIEQPGLNTEIAETQAALESIQPMRTMEKDMEHSSSKQPVEEEPVYSNTQEALLREAKKIDDSSPRWGEAS